MKDNKYDEKDHMVAIVPQKTQKHSAAENCEGVP
jgi:hypothetical protein